MEKNKLEKLIEQGRIKELLKHVSPSSTPEEIVENILSNHDEAAKKAAIETLREFFTEIKQKEFKKIERKKLSELREQKFVEKDLDKNAKEELKTKALDIVKVEFTREYVNFVEATLVSEKRLNKKRGYFVGCAATNLTNKYFKLIKKNPRKDEWEKIRGELKNHYYDNNGYKSGNLGIMSGPKKVPPIIYKNRYEVDKDDNDDEKVED